MDPLSLMLVRANDLGYMRRARTPNCSHSIDGIGTQFLMVTNSVLYSRTILLTLQLNYPADSSGCTQNG